MISALAVGPSLDEDGANKDQDQNKNECAHAAERTPERALYVYWIGV